MRREHARQRDRAEKPGTRATREHGASRHKKSHGRLGDGDRRPRRGHHAQPRRCSASAAATCAWAIPLAIGALKTIRTNEIGAGLRLNAQIDAEFLGLTDEQALAWEANTEREFALWADARQLRRRAPPHVRRAQALARLSQLMSGDVFVLLPPIERAGDRYDLRVKLLEADRVSDPWPYPVGRNVLGGVEVDGDGAPLAYYVAQVHPGDCSSRAPAATARGAVHGGGTELPPVLRAAAYGAQSTSGTASRRSAPRRGAAWCCTSWSRSAPASAAACRSSRR
jgi:capsid protein